MKIVCFGGGYKFTVLPAVLYVFFVTLFVALGYWQLERAEAKKRWLEQQQQAPAQDMLELASLVGDNSSNYYHRTIKLTGVYDAKHQFLLDNQIVDGKAGYFVMTPFKIARSEQAVLVNRGWVPLNKDRRVLPDLSIATAKQSVLGGVNQFPQVGILLAGATVPTAQWPSVVQVIDAQVLAAKLGYNLLPVQIELSPDSNEGYHRQWRGINRMSPAKHRAYAVQWVLLAIVLSVLFIRFSKVDNESTK